MTQSFLFAGGGTGGHVFPMLAVATALQKLLPAARLVFVGTARGLEARLVPEHGYELELVDVVPLRGQGLAGGLRGVLRASASLGHARKLLRRVAPSVVLSAGGYAAGPVSLAAVVGRIPVAVMEPNGVLGLSNRLLAPFAERFYTAFAESERQLSARAVLRTGVPIREGFWPRSLAPRGPALSVLVLGGSQGARALNEAVPEALSRAKTPTRIVHQCGAGAAEVLERYRALGLAERTEVVTFIDDMPSRITQADLVVSRAGASALAEICAVGRASLLVPYPFAAGDHQRVNADALERAGAALCVLPEQATSDRLAMEIDALAQGDRLARMATAAVTRGRPDAAEAVARDLIRLAGLEHSARERAEAPAAGSFDNGSMPTGPALVQEAS